jgi:hypothetical protein
VYDAESMIIRVERALADSYRGRGGRLSKVRRKRLCGDGTCRRIFFIHCVCDALIFFVFSAIKVAVLYLDIRLLQISESASP